MSFDKWLKDFHPFAPTTIAIDQGAEKVEQIDDNPETMVPPEAWIWVKGYKGTDRNMICRDQQYILGEQFDIPDGDAIAVCHHGIHFCKDLTGVFRFYDIGDGNRFFEVEALVRKSDLYNPDNFSTIMNPYDRRVDRVSYRSYRPYNDDKYVARSIRFIRELTPDEVFAKHHTHTMSDVKNWTEEEKLQAMATSINQVRSTSRITKLVDAGYSEPFARYISSNPKRFEIAMAVASQPGLSMDVKVMTIFIDTVD